MDTEQLTYSFLVQLRDLRKLADSLQDMDIEATGPEDRQRICREYLVKEGNLTTTVSFLRLHGVGK